MMMPDRKKSLRIATLVAAVVLLAWYAYEPMYGGRTVTGWVEALGHEFAEPTAQHAFDQIGPRVIPRLVDLLGKRDPILNAKLDRLLGPFGLNLFRPRAYRTRLGAVRAFQQLGAKALPAVPKILLLLKEPDLETDARNALVAIGPAVTPKLILALEDEHPKVRAGAAWCLSVFRQEGDAISAALLRKVQDPDLGVRLTIVEALGNFEKQAPLVLPALAKALEDPMASVRAKAANQIGRFNEKGNPAASALHKARSDSDPAVRDAATNALRRIDLLKMAAQEAGVTDINLSSVTSVLLGYLKNPDPTLRTASALALKRRADANTVVMPALIANLSDTNTTVQAYAIQALSEFGPAAVTAAPHILEIACRPGNQNQWAARRALASIEPAAAVDLDGFYDALNRNPQFSGRFYTYSSLRPQGTPAVPALSQVIRSSEGSLRDAALTVLRRIDPEAAANVAAP
jgi:HEAT repeat protein